MSQAKRRLFYLSLATLWLLFAFLGFRELWTQEHRWADITYGMLFRHDFFHPFLENNPYYDKPLLSYWLILATSWIKGTLSLTSIRLPSALAGVLAIISLYRIALHLYGKQCALLAAWMLLTTFYFVFWARTGNADMLNLGGTLFALCWYVERKHKPTLTTYTVFFSILALTSLCKGLLGAAVVLIAILPDYLKNARHQHHVNWKSITALLLALTLYLLPFYLSTVTNDTHYAGNGLFEVYKENIVRYFNPFDHKGPLYTYFIYVPIYLLPWTFLFVPALYQMLKQWLRLRWEHRWMILAFSLIFLFFTLSGSRRNYYALPMVPFAILLTANWISNITAHRLHLQKLAYRIAFTFFGLFALFFTILQPLNDHSGGMTQFTTQLKQVATNSKPWHKWRVISLDARGNVRFYLRISPLEPTRSVKGDRDIQTLESLKAQWPIISEKNNDIIFVSRRQYTPLLKQLLPGYKMIDTPPDYLSKLTGKRNGSDPVGFVP